MSITPGYTDDQIRDFVYEYERKPHGIKYDWLKSQGVSRQKLRRWRDAIFEGDLERGLVPRENYSAKRAAVERRMIAAHQSKEAIENERLRARVQELEAANEALGKAIGLLHQLNEQEPDTTLTSEPPSSSEPKPTSSPPSPKSPGHSAKP